METQKGKMIICPSFSLQRYQDVVGFKSQLSTYQFVHTLNKLSGIQLHLHNNSYKITNGQVSAYFPIFYDYKKWAENVHVMILLVNKTSYFERDTINLNTQQNESATLFSQDSFDSESSIYYAISNSEYSVFKARSQKINMDYFLMFDSLESGDFAKSTLDKILKINDFPKPIKLDYSQQVSQKTDIKTWKDCFDNIYMEMSNYVDEELYRDQKKLKDYTDSLIKQRSENLKKNQSKYIRFSDH